MLLLTFVESFFFVIGSVGNFQCGKQSSVGFESGRMIGSGKLYELGFRDNRPVSLE